jgi:hypothetical protein
VLYPTQAELELRRLNIARRRSPLLYPIRSRKRGDVMITEEQKKKMRRLHKIDKMDIPAIARLMGLKYRTVQYWLDPKAAREKMSIYNKNHLKRRKEDPERYKRKI